MEFTASQIAAMLGGRVEGDQNAKVANLSKIEEGKPHTLTFLANPKYTDFIYSTGATIAIVAEDFVAERALPSTLTLVRVKDAYGSFAKLLEAYNQFRQPKPGIDSRAIIADSAKVGDNVYIGGNVVISEGAQIATGAKIYPGCFVGENVKIGANTILFAGVRIYSDCVIGSNCTIHSGVVIGGDGFGFAPNSENNYSKVPQIGNVIIEDYVEIGANTTVDRATLGSTIIRKGVKLDNLIQIAHNVEIGENTVIAAQTGVAGSTKIGKNCMIGGQVGIVGHLVIADGVKIAAQSGISQSIKDENSIVQGSPAFSHIDYQKSYIGFRKLPELMRELAQLKREVEALKKDSASE